MLAIHGRWKIKVVDKVLMQWFADSWNEEAITSYVKEFKAAAGPLINDEWAIISIFEHWELGVPEIEHRVIELCQWFRAHGCVKDCHVYKYDKIKNMQLEKMIPNSEGRYKRLVFENINEAMAWLETEGFTVSQPEFLYDTISKAPEVKNSAKYL